MIDGLNVLGDSYSYEVLDQSNVTIVRNNEGYTVAEMSGKLSKGQAFSLALTHKLAYEAGQRSVKNIEPNF